MHSKAKNSPHTTHNLNLKLLFIDFDAPNLMLNFYLWSKKAKVSDIIHVKVYFKILEN